MCDIKMYTTVQKFGDSIIVCLFFIKVILLFSKDAFNCSKVTVKTLIMLQEIYQISCSFIQKKYTAFLFLI